MNKRSIQYTETGVVEWQLNAYVTGATWKKNYISINTCHLQPILMHACTRARAPPTHISICKCNEVPNNLITQRKSRNSAPKSTKLHILQLTQTPTFTHISLSHYYKIQTEGWTVWEAEELTDSKYLLHWILIAAHYNHVYKFREEY